MSENSPLLPPLPQSTPPAPSSQAHSRSRSDFVPTQSDPAHPFNRGGGGQRLPPAGNRPRSRPPPRNAGVPPPPIPGTGGSPGGAKGPPKPLTIHRRAKSDVPLIQSVGSGGSVSKADLLKNFPDPRWGGSSLNTSQHRTRTSSDGGILLMAGAADAASSGYGATSSGGAHPLLGPDTIGSVVLNDVAKRPARHARTMSDASVHSVTTNMANSALFRGVTEKGTLQLQLPKDGFRVLMDSQLEAGCVYKRKLIDDEDELFVDFHTLEEGEGGLGGGFPAYQEKKRLPPDMYVMAVDSTLYRRILDEIIDSKTMPCGTYFCGHHEDVRHPSVMIAATIVSFMFLLLLAGAIFVQD